MHDANIIIIVDFLIVGGFFCVATQKSRQIEYLLHIVHQLPHGS
jgi:hypothetical protein